MIEFLNYPPKQSDDVKLSSEGKRTLRKQISDGLYYRQMSGSPERVREEEIKLSDALYYMGQAIGHVIVSSLAEPNKEFAMKLKDAIHEDYQENVVTDPGSYSSFPSGIRQGVEDAVKFREREMEVSHL